VADCPLDSSIHSFQMASRHGWVPYGKPETCVGAGRSTPLASRWCWRSCRRVAPGDRTAAVGLAVYVKLRNRSVVQPRLDHEKGVRKPREAAWRTREGVQRMVVHASGAENDGKCLSGEGAGRRGASRARAAELAATRRFLAGCRGPPEAGVEALRPRGCGEGCGVGSARPPRINVGPRRFEGRQERVRCPWNTPWIAGAAPETAASCRAAAGSRGCTLPWLIFSDQHVGGSNLGVRSWPRERQGRLHGGAAGPSRGRNTVNGPVTSPNVPHDHDSSGDCRGWTAPFDQQARGPVRTWASGASPGRSGPSELDRSRAPGVGPDEGVRLHSQARELPRCLEETTPLPTRADGLGYENAHVFNRKQPSHRGPSGASATGA